MPIWYARGMGPMLLYKKLGETPLEAIERFRLINPLYKNVPMTYAGRLDPAAEGLLVLLAGDLCKEKDLYTKLPKVYEVKMLFGFSTDTHDLLGIPVEKKNKITLSLEDIETELRKIFTNTPITINQKYPAYSSKTVGGESLISLARKGIAVALPKHKVELYSGEIKSTETLSSIQIESRVREICDLVSGDFRQEETLVAWRKILKNWGHFTVVTCTISVGSGFYVRTFVDDIGKKLKTGAVVYSLKRTSVGDYKI